MGFTLIELLIVVAIISVLAAIAVPNFLEAQTRAKVSRVKADQRSLTTAIESYAVDNNKYPVRRDAWDTQPKPVFAFPPFKEKIYDPDKPTASVGLHVVTTPIAYMTSLPVDPFYVQVKAMAQPDTPFSQAIDYWDPLQADTFVGQMAGVFRSGAAKGYILVSVGPDGAMNVSPLGTPGGYPSPPESWLLAWKSEIYDSTNGTVSPGNIYRFQGGLEARDL